MSVAKPGRVRGASTSSGVSNCSCVVVVIAAALGRLETPPHPTLLPRAGRRSRSCIEGAAQGFGQVGGVSSDHSGADNSRSFRPSSPIARRAMWSIISEIERGR